MSVYLASDPNHKGDRHNREGNTDDTACGYLAGDEVTIALPVNCPNCRYIAGQRIKDRRDREIASIMAAAEDAGLTLMRWDIVWTPDGSTIDGMDPEEWISVMTQD
ncbi:hypothetical protein [Streptomyces sp. NPDC002644]